MVSLLDGVSTKKIKRADLFTRFQPFTFINELSHKLQNNLSLIPFKLCCSKLFYEIYKNCVLIYLNKNCYSESNYKNYNH